LYLAYRHFGRKAGESSEGVEGRQGKHQGFWWTVLSIELMDLAFSVDNVLVAVAFADPGLQASPEQKQGALILLYFGVFIGILAMRFVAQYFIGLMERYPRLEHSAYLVIGILGLKLCLGDWVAVRAGDLPMIGSFLGHPEAGHWADMGFSMFTLAVFAWPLLVGRRSASRKNRSEVS
jgi:predicted tellurium resistance membrane protein TerC